MKTQAQTIKGLAQELFDAMEWRKRADGSDFCCMKDATTDHAVSINEWAAALVHAVHDAMDNRGPDDDVYSSIREAAGIIADSADTEAARGAFEGLGGDVHNADRLAWLSRNPNNIAWVDEAMENYGGGGNAGIMGFIGYGQAAFKQAVAHATLAELERLA